MIKVYKYAIDPVNRRVMMPAGAEILTVGCQGDEICVCAKVDTNNPYRERVFYIYGDGLEMDSYRDNMKYIGTAVMNKDVALHVWEVIGS